ncbi:MAG: hypothetical protein IJU60_06565 [Acholeplasmatales bacterium]|nr:hypothetical protein [Acholeplasmatales bacterium]
MICKICGNKFFIKRSFKELLKTNHEQNICNKCLDKYGISLSFQKIVLENYDVMIVSMFKRKEKIDYNLFYDEYSKIFISLMMKKEYHVILEDHLYLDDYKIEEIDGISKMLESNLIILCLTVSDYS